MAAEDAGSIFSEVRIRLDKLKQDIVQATLAIDSLGDEFTRNADQYANIAGKKYKAALESIAKEIRNVNAAEKSGALSTQEQIERLLRLRKEELQVLQNKAVKEGTASAQTVAAINNTKTAILQLEAAEKKLTPKQNQGINALSIAAVAASAAIIAAFRSVITPTAEYGQALSDVQAATRGTAEELASLESAAAEAGDELATSTTDALGAVEALAKAGVTTADIMGGALPGALTLAAAGSLDVSDAAEIAAATMTQFGLAGSEVTHIADILAAGAGKAQGEVSDLSQALKQAGLVASQTGLKVDDTVGTLAAFASAGLLGSDAGTSFRTMLLRLTPQSKEAATEMKKLGINAFDTKGEFIGITSFAGQLQERLKGLTTEQRNAALATIFGSDSIRAANVLYNQGAEGIGEWIKKVNDTGFAANTARIKLDNLSGDLKKLDAATTDAGAAVGTALTPALRGAAQFAATLFEFIAGLPAPILVFIGTVATLVGGLIAIAAAGPPVIATLVSIGTAAAGALGPIGLIVSAIALVGGAVVAASSAINSARLEEAIGKFGNMGKEAGLAGEKLEKFAKSAADAESFLIGMSREGIVVGKAFERLAKDMGLTNDQLAQIALNSPKTSEAMKKLAKTFIDQEAQAARDAKFQAQRFADMDKHYAKDLPKAVATGADAILPKLKSISDAIAFQNYLEKLGLVTTQEALTAKIQLREDEIDKIQEAGELQGFLTKAQQEQIRALTASNKDNQASLDKLKKAEEDASKASEEALAKEKANREAISALLTTEIQKIEAQRDALLESAQTEEERAAIILEAEERIQAIRKASQDKQDKILADGLKQQQATFKAYTDFAFSTFSGLITALGDILANLNQQQVDDLTARYESERELIENNGLTKKQALEKELADAKLTGDAEKIAEAEKQLALFNLELEFTKKKAEIEYQAARQSWALQVALAIAQAAQATLNAFSSTAAIPIIGPGLAPFAAAAAAAVGALQIAAVIKSEPQPPKFATGGIVLGNSTSGDNVPALVNSGEMILTREQQAKLFDMANGGGGQVGGSLTIVLEIDGKAVSRVVTGWQNSGQIRVKV